MDILQLRYFAETAKRLHFAHAAEHLKITQSALSKSIQKLEAELGFQLFSRENKWDIQLTIPGEVYLQETTRILREIDNARNLALTAGHGESGRLVIGAISSMLGQKAFIDTMAGIRKKTPRVVIEVIDSTSGELLSLLKEHKVDLAFLRIGQDFNDDHFIRRELFMDRLSVAVPKGHRLTGKDKLKVSDLANENFILVPETVSAVFRNYILDFCRKKGMFEPRIIQEVNNNYTALRLVAAKCGITIVSSAYQETFRENLCYLNIADFQPELPMSALFPAGRTFPLTEKFIAEFLRFYKGNLQGTSEIRYPAFENTFEF